MVSWSRAGPIPWALREADLWTEWHSLAKDPSWWQRGSQDSDPGSQKRLATVTPVLPSVLPGAVWEVPSGHLLSFKTVSG